jgi:hypothetical protein
MPASNGADAVANDDPGQFLPRQDVKPVGDAWADYWNAKTVGDTKTEAVVDTPKKHRITLDVPTAWVGEGVWRPVKDDPLNYIRARYFTGPGAEESWKNEQAMTDLYENVHGEAQNGNYLMTADHKALKVAVFKLFATDNAHPDNSFYLVECHIAHDAADRDALWSACKTAVTSATFKTQ